MKCVNIMASMLLNTMNYESIVLFIIWYEHIILSLENIFSTVSHCITEKTKQYNS